MAFFTSAQTTWRTVTRICIGRRRWPKPGLSLFLLRDARIEYGRHRKSAVAAFDGNQFPRTFECFKHEDIACCGIEQSGVPIIVIIVAREIYNQFFRLGKVDYFSKSLIKKLDPDLEKTASLLEKCTRSYGFEIAFTGEKLPDDAVLQPQQLVCYNKIHMRRFSRPTRCRESISNRPF